MLKDLEGMEGFELNTVVLIAQQIHQHHQILNIANILASHFTILFIHQDFAQQLEHTRNPSLSAEM